MMVAREPPLPAILSQDNLWFRVSAECGGNGGWAGNEVLSQNEDFRIALTTRQRGARGFSLLEMMIVCLLDHDRGRNRPSWRCSRP